MKKTVIFIICFALGFCLAGDATAQATRMPHDSTIAYPSPNKDTLYVVDQTAYYEFQCVWSDEKYAKSKPVIVLVADLERRKKPQIK